MLYYVEYEILSKGQRAFAMCGIPIVIGVTGHRDLRPQDEPALFTRVCDELQKLLLRCPHSEWIMLNSLASGADQLCARAAIKLSIPVVAALPMPLAEYEADFSGETLSALQSIVESCRDVFVVPDAEGRAEPTRDYAYRQAGIYVARHCHVLLALWDGLPGRPNGCGTAETVGFLINETYKSAEARLHTPEDGVVLHIVTPRLRNPEPPADAFIVRLLGKQPDAFFRTLALTDAYNSDAAVVTDTHPLFSSAALHALDTRTQRLHTSYCVADSLALRFRDKYLSALVKLSATGVMLMLAFLLYDEAEANLFLPVYALVAGIALCVFLGARRGEYHRKYLEYRFLAELLRVQLCLFASGINREVTTLLSRAQAADLSWVHDALQAGSLGGPSGATIDTEQAWIDSQLAYHTSSCAKLLTKQARQQRVSNGMLAASAAFFLLVCVLEFGLPAQLAGAHVPPAWLMRLFIMHDGAAFGVRSLLKLLLGIIPAITLFVSSYYGKLSLSRKINDRHRMINLFSEAKREYAAHPEARDAILTELAREELAEAGEWRAYCSDNRLDILL